MLQLVRLHHMSKPLLLLLLTLSLLTMFNRGFG